MLDAIDSLPLPHRLREFLAFGYKQALSCSFAGSFFALLFLTTQVDWSPLHRYDVILIGAIAIQIVLVLTKRESIDELKVIMVFHLLGFALESFKTHPAIESWTYPEDAWTKLGTVPLYSGFMYSAVGSYISQSWRNFDLRLVGYPPPIVTTPLGVAIYVNFFTNAYVHDVRWFLLAAVGIVFVRTRVFFTPLDRPLWMPLALSFVLIGFFVWVAENISTFFDAWQYPNQAQGWDVVDADKITSWALLVIVSIILVANLKHVKAARLSHTDSPGSSTEP